MIHHTDPHAMLQEAAEAGCWLSVNTALVCMSRDGRALVADRERLGNSPRERVGFVLRSLGGQPSRAFAVVAFDHASPLVLPLDIWPRPSARPDWLSATRDTLADVERGERV